jgi:hypothetical protein
MVMNLIESDAELCALVYDALELPTREIYTIEQVGILLPAYAHPGELFLVPPGYWERLKKEFQLFVCTKDKKYASLRKDLGAKARGSQTVIVSTISAAMAHSVGVAAGILIPFCALCLLALARVGKEAFCKCTKLDVPINR